MPGAPVEALPLQSPTLPPATHTNCYLLGSRRLTLIDPASPWSEERALLERHLLKRGAEVERVFLTHHHSDHVGAAAWARQRFQVPVVAHPRTRALLAGEVEVDEVLGEGEELVVESERWLALHTPGHASGHLCLYDPRGGSLIAGDMVAGVGTIVLDPPEGDLGLYLASLTRLQEMAPARLLPAHGPAIERAVALLGEYIAHRHLRTGQVRAALKAVGVGSPEALVPSIYPDLHPLMRPVAARQVLCHLEWLAGREEVYREGGAWRLNGA